MTRGERRKTWYWGSRESLGNTALSLKFLSICSHEAPNSQGEQNLRVVEETKAPSRLWIYLNLHPMPLTADSLFKSCPPQYMDETWVSNWIGPGPFLSLRSCWYLCHCHCYGWVNRMRIRVGGVWGSEKRVGVRWVWVGSGRQCWVRWRHRELSTW